MNAWQLDFSKCPNCGQPWREAVSNDGCMVWCGHGHCDCETANAGETARTFAEAKKNLHTRVEAKISQK